MVHSIALLLVQLVAHVNNVEQNVRLHYFLQGRLKSSHQLMGQALNKTNRVSQNGLLLMGQLQLTGSGVQRCKKLILGINIRIGQRIEQS